MSAAGLLYGLLRPRAAQAVGNQAQLALKEFDPCEHAAIVAEAVFVERGVNFFDQPKWVVASYSTLVSGCRRDGSLLEVAVMTRDVRSPSFANC